MCFGAAPRFGINEAAAAKAAVRGALGGVGGSVRALESSVRELIGPAESEVAFLAEFLGRDDLDGDDLDG